MNTKDSIIWHLDREYTAPVRDPLWKHIYLSPGLMKVVDSPDFQQLHRIKQLGPSYLVYPGATHTRLNHSFGVFHLARRIIRALLSFDSCMPLSVEGVKAFLCAALLHDVGHFPYAHSLKDLPLRDHEQLTGQIILSSPLREIIRSDVGTDPEFVAAIVDLSHPADNDEVAFFRHILSGTLDPDKLDYLNRDAYFCGVPYGIQDIDFAISRMRPFGSAGLAMDISGISAIEHILFSKYLMYRAVYWHRTVRVATAMIKKAVLLALRDEVIRPEELYGLDDELFFSRLSGIDYPPFELITRVPNRELYRVVWDTPFHENDPIHQRLTELETRTEAEAVIADRLSTPKLSLRPEEIIIDIPENISFEVTIPVVNDAGVVDYMDSGTVFTHQVVEDFTRTLRRVRLIVSPRAATLVGNAPVLLAEALSGSV
ncbi:MAG TPA: HD domain-containing protein [Spirochaetia bacterium]|nr:HD domain-containing protein [Spirochaetia bacterium]